MIYTAGWIFMFFGVVYPVLMPSEGDTDGTTTTTGGGDERGARAYSIQRNAPHSIAQLLLIRFGCFGSDLYVPPEKTTRLKFIILSSCKRLC